MSQLIVVHRNPHENFRAVWNLNTDNEGFRIQTSCNGTFKIYRHLLSYLLLSSVECSLQPKWMRLDVPSHINVITQCRVSQSRMANKTLQWRHNEHDDVSNHQSHDCLVNRLFRRTSKKPSRLRVTGLFDGNSPVAGEFPAQRASNAENVFIWWRHHERRIDNIYFKVLYISDNCKSFLDCIFKRHFKHLYSCPLFHC